MTKTIHTLVQGSPDWKEYRLKMRGASEAAAMLGLSPNVSRTELLHMKYTCTAQEFSDWVQVNILDHGHEVEALARPLAEDIVSTELYPVTCSIDKLSASCDGLTMAEDEGWEHKQWNAALAEAVEAGHVPDTHMPQVQQELMVTGATRWLFMVSDGTVDNMVYTWVLPDAAWFERIRAGWEQFEADLAIYEPKNFTPKPAAAPIMALPALAIQIKGEVTLSNLPVFKAKADRFIASIKTDLLTDEDFANAEATIKFCEQAEDNIGHAKESAIAQTASVDELMRTLDHISDQLREKRLLLTRTVKDKKDLLKADILNKAKLAFGEHVAALEQEIAPIRLVYQLRDFAGAMKNKRTLKTLHDAVDTELANGKIALDALARAVRGRLAWYNETVGVHVFLFADIQSLIQKPDDDFKLAVISRIDAHKVKVAEQAEADRARIQAEVAAEAQRKLVAAPAAAEPAPFDACTTGSSEVSMQERPIGVLAPAAGWPFPTERRTVAPTSAPTLRIGQITERLGFTFTADFLRSLGFEPAARDKAACLYHEADFEHICRALIRHIATVQNTQPQAA